MARMTIAAAFGSALAALSVLPAGASAASGDYAKRSVVYAEYIANCKVERNTRPDLRDEAARKLEKMSPEQFKLQIKGCQMSLPKPAAQRQATNVPPAAIVGSAAVAGAVVARAAMRRNGQRDDYRGGSRSFENVAEDSQYVKTNKGWEYNLGRLRGPTYCPAPKLWHRTEECKGIDRGGVRCRMECR